MTVKNNPRTLAAARGEKTYKMTKPCRRGHVGERYTSCGLCVACVQANQEERRIELKKAKRIANTAKFEPAQVWRGLVRPAHHDMFAELADVCALGTPEQIEQAAAFIFMLRQQVR